MHVVKEAFGVRESRIVTGGVLSTLAAATLLGGCLVLSLGSGDTETTVSTDKQTTTTELPPQEVLAPVIDPVTGQTEFFKDPADLAKPLEIPVISAAIGLQGSCRAYRFLRPSTSLDTREQRLEFLDTHFADKVPVDASGESKFPLTILDGISDSYLDNPATRQALWADISVQLAGDPSGVFGWIDNGLAQADTDIYVPSCEFTPAEPVATTTSLEPGA